MHELDNLNKSKKVKVKQMKSMQANRKIGKQTSRPVFACLLFSLVEKAFVFFLLLVSLTNILMFSNQTPTNSSLISHLIFCICLTMQS